MIFTKATFQDPSDAVKLGFAILFVVWPFWNAHK